MEVAKHAIKKNNIMLTVFSYQNASFYRLSLRLKFERKNMDE